MLLPPCTAETERVLANFLCSCWKFAKT